MKVSHVWTGGSSQTIPWPLPNLERTLTGPNFDRITQVALHWPEELAQSFTSTLALAPTPYQMGSEGRNADTGPLFDTNLLKEIAKKDLVSALNAVRSKPLSSWLVCWNIMHTTGERSKDAGSRQLTCGASWSCD